MNCAIKIQQTVKEIDDLNLRIGIHQGDILEKGGDVFGDDVNIASRIEPFAAVGGVAITNKVAGDISGSPEFELKLVGQPKLKGVKQSIRIYCITSHGLPETDISDVSAKLEEVSLPATPLQQVIAAHTTHPMPGKRYSGKTILVAVAIILTVAFYFYDILPPKGTGIESLAVLPFDNISGDPEQVYFVDGMHETLLTELSKISALRVVSRTSVLHYKGSEKSLTEIAQELGVDAVIEGSVIRSGDRVRITAQLIKVMPERHLWADNYDRDLKDALLLMSAVAQDIAMEVRITLTPDEKDRISSARQVDPESYQLYLKGRYHLNTSFLEEGIWKAVEYFQESIDKDPTYAPAYSGLADAYNSLTFFTILPPRETYSKAKAAAMTALELDSTLGEAYVSLGYFKWIYNWNWSSTDELFEQAIKISPNNVNAHLWYSYYLAFMGRFDESIDEITRAVELDPLSPGISLKLGQHNFMARRYDESIRQLKKTFELAPDFSWVHTELAWNYAMQGRYVEAVGECKKALAQPSSNDNQLFLGTLGWVYAVSGYENEARDLLHQLMELSTNRWIDPFWVAMTYAGLSDKDLAFEWLEKAYEERSPAMVYIKVPPQLDSLRDDPRYSALMKRMGLE